MPERPDLIRYFIGEEEFYIRQQIIERYRTPSTCLQRLLVAHALPTHLEGNRFFFRRRDVEVLMSQHTHVRRSNPA